jgi:hypothetical protein
VRNAWINFTTNELCFNDRACCVVNPTFLPDVQAEAQGPAFEGRETVGLAFGEAGRVDTRQGNRSNRVTDRSRTRRQAINT